MMRVCLYETCWGKCDVRKKVKYAYYELPHTENTASPPSQNVERKREHGSIKLSILNKTLAPTGSHINKQVQIETRTIEVKSARQRLEE
jgi:hypothetical protein